jgi:hypothetical protein
MDEAGSPMHDEHVKKVTGTRKNLGFNGNSKV